MSRPWALLMCVTGAFIMGHEATAADGSMFWIVFAGVGVVANSALLLLGDAPKETER